MKSKRRGVVVSGPPVVEDLSAGGDAPVNDSGDRPRDLKEEFGHLAGKVHVHVCVPCYDCKMSREFFMSLLQLQAMSTKLGITLSTDLLGNESLITRGRNILAAKFLKGPGTHLLFIDADIAFDPVSVFKLAAFDKDVSSCIYPKKNVDFHAVRTKMKDGDKEPIHAMGLDFNLNIVGREAKVIDGAFIRVLDTATGFMMIKRDALQRVVDAFRETHTAINDITNSKDLVPEYVTVFDTLIDPETKRYLSEDYAFCRRAQGIGLEIYASIVDPLAHVGSKHLHGDINQRFQMSYAG